MPQVVPNVEFGSEAQPLPTHEHDVSKERGTSGLRVGASKDFSAESSNWVIRIPLELLRTNGRARLGELLTHARVEAFDNERPLSAVETTAKPEHGLALLQFVVLSSKLGHGATQLGRAVDEVVDQLLIQRFLP